MKIIGIVGIARSGKSSASEVLEKYGFVVKSFGSPIKWIALQNTNWNGKDKGKKERKLFQGLGDVLREYDPRCIVRPIEKYIEARVKMVDFETSKKKPRKVEEIKIVIDDVRPEPHDRDIEAKLIKDLGGTVIKLTGKANDLGELGDHITEQEIDPEYIDYVLEIPDMGSKKAFQEEFEKRIKDLGIV